jgi:hypothetical protein
MEGVEMTESPYFNEILAQGEMRMAREAQTEVVKGRFPEALTPDVERAIADQPSLPLMRQWIAAAARGRARSCGREGAVKRRTIGSSLDAPRRFVYASD